MYTEGVLTREATVANFTTVQTEGDSGLFLMLHMDTLLRCPCYLVIINRKSVLKKSLFWL